MVSFVQLLRFGSFYCPDLDSLISVGWFVCSLSFHSVSCSDFVCCLFFFLVFYCVYIFSSLVHVDLITLYDCVYCDGNELGGM